MKRLRLFILFIVGMLLLGLLVFGDRFDQWLLSSEGIVWLRSHGPLAGLLGAGLIVSDLFLPIPSPGLMTALGHIYGWFVGGLFAALGSTGAGLVAYFLVRGMGPRAAVRIAGEGELAQLRRFFDKSGPWAIALTRMLPVVPEVLCCLAGLARMPFQRFLASLLSGSLPAAFVFSGIGTLGGDAPASTFLLATALPFLVFPPVWLLIQRRAAKAEI